MKLVKSLLLGSAAGIVAVGSAVAADLPVRKAAPVDYVQVCSAFGTGYFYIPGTDTCLKAGGFVRYEARYSESRWGTPAATAGAGAGGALTATPNVPTPAASTRGAVFSQFARAALTLDARTATEFGTLRSYAELYFDGNNALTTDQAFIEFAGFTFGKRATFFRTVGAPGYGATPLIFRTGGNNAPLIAYTLDAGAFSAFVSLEDSRNNDAGAAAIAFGGGASNTLTAVQRRSSGMPDVVAGVEFSQGDVRVRLSGALSEIRTNRLDTAGNHINSEFGYALQAGAVFGLPMIGPNTNIQIQGTYAEGAVSYAGVGQAGNRFTLQTADAYVNAAGSIRKSTAWNIYGSLNHAWTPQVSQTFYASYGEYDAPSAVRRTWAAGVTPFNIQEDPAQFSSFQIGNIISWTPVAGLMVGLDTSYTQTDAKRRILTSGTANAAGSTYTSKDHNWAATLRVQRSF